jgi:hypothetical protein
LNFKSQTISGSWPGEVLPSAWQNESAYLFALADLLALDRPRCLNANMVASYANADLSKHYATPGVIGGLQARETGCS